MDVEQVTGYVVDVVAAIAANDRRRVHQVFKHVNDCGGDEDMFLLVAGLAGAIGQMWNLPTNEPLGFAILDRDDEIINPEQAGRPGQIAAWRFIVASLNRDAPLAHALFDGIDDEQGAFDFLDTMVGLVAVAARGQRPTT